VVRKTKSPYHGYRFPAVVIGCAVRWYFRFSLRLRNVYRAVDKAGDTVDFLFRAKRGKAAARRYFEKAIAGKRRTEDGDVRQERGESQQG
jgi:transposase-like protein